MSEAKLKNLILKLINERNSAIFKLSEFLSKENISEATGLSQEKIEQIVEIMEG